MSIYIILYNINEIYVIKKYCLYNYDINKGVKTDCTKQGNQRAVK